MGRYSLFMNIFLLHLLFGIIADLGVAGKGECSESRCGYDEPAIRFPFYLKGHQPVHCGYPGFDLYCNHYNQTVLQLPSSVEVLVRNIDYKSQEIKVYDDHCPPRQLPYLNLSASPFQLKLDHSMNYTFFNCSSSLSEIRNSYCFDDLGYYVSAIPSDSFVFDYYYIFSCTKIPNFSSIPLELDLGNLKLDSEKLGLLLNLNWSKQILCGNCEARGQKCIMRKNSTNTEPELECFDKPGSTASRGVVAGAMLGFFLLVIIIFALYEAHSSDKTKKQNEVKIEKFLENYTAFKPTRYSYADIKRITNQFKDKLGQGGYGTVFKGKLSNEILVAVKILNNAMGNGEEFINEVGTMSTIHHVNVVRLVGFCAEGSKRALIYEFLPNESLEKFIFLADNKQPLSWEKIQDIAIGIAKGIEYLHQGCNQRILHFDIKPHNILLDDNFNPKISDFGMAKLCSKGQSAVSMTAARGTMGYIAPEVLSRNFGNVSYKSDVYSFGMLLLEMVGGRKNIDVRVENTSQVYFPEWIYDRLDQGEELRIRIEEEGDAEIARKITIVGLWCIQWYPANRPSMKVVLQMLEGDGDNLTIPPNPFVPTIQTNSTGIMPGRHFRKELELPVIPESD